MSRPIQVYLPMITFVPGEMGGSETATNELLDALSLRDDVELEISVASPALGTAPSGVAETVVESFRGGASPASRARTVARSWLRPGKAAEPFARSELVHYPYAVPAPRPPRDLPFVQTLFDVQHLDLPHLFSRAERIYRQLTYDATARRADAVVTTSEFSKGRISAQLQVPPDRIHVAPLGVRPDLDQSRRVPGNYVLYPARAWTHKNHNRLVRALEMVRQTRPELRLVLTGGQLDLLGPLPEWVEVRGQVPAEELQRLYRHAACLAFPSLYEGFGLPLLEAMSLGCPVAASNRAALPEVAGDAAVLFDPEDTAAAAAAIVRAIDDRERLTVAGFQRAQWFTWERCAERHTEIYRTVVSQDRARRRP